MAGEVKNLGNRQQQILKLLLDNRQGLSIDQVANALSISRNAVQQHFAGLEKEGLVETGQLDKTAGRPVRRFVLTEKGIDSFPKQYAWFSGLLVADLKSTMGSEPFKAYLGKLGNALAQTLSHRFAGKTLPQRVQELTAVMTGLGFEAKVIEEPSSDELVVEAVNCIYHDLAQTHQEICEFDKALIKALLSTEIELVTCMAKGDHQCRFKIQP
ncbi:MAG: ArsR family transcriptional regulator [Methylobacter sp.]|nr:MAG: ArsR family transcriptional regulator [Methylobacter sp.]